jgi:hypothetical protein
MRNRAFVGNDIIRYGMLRGIGKQFRYVFFLFPEDGLNTVFFLAPEESAELRKNKRTAVRISS